jgi:hypothetical protein
MPARRGGSFEQLEGLIVELLPQLGQRTPSTVESPGDGRSWSGTGAKVRGRSDRAHRIGHRGQGPSPGSALGHCDLTEREDERLATEQDVYASIGPWIPPDLREDAGEVEAALAGRLLALIELGDAGPGWRRCCTESGVTPE